MLKSVKFVSRDEEPKLQDIEGDPGKIPFDIASPDSDSISLSKPASFSVKLTRQSKALQHMSWLWTGEVTVSGRGYRVIATGAGGTFRIPANITDDYLRRSTSGSTLSMDWVRSIRWTATTPSRNNAHSRGGYSG